MLTEDRHVASIMLGLEIHWCINSYSVCMCVWCVCKQINLSEHSSVGEHSLFIQSLISSRKGHQEERHRRLGM